MEDSTMPMMTKNPLIIAVLLTSLICGSCMAVVSLTQDSHSEDITGATATLSVSARAEASSPGKEQVDIKDLLVRIERLEGQIASYRKSSKEPQMMAMLEGFKSEIESFRKSEGQTQVDSDRSLPPQSVWDPTEAEYLKNSSLNYEESSSRSSESPVHDFVFEEGVQPESIVIVQGAVPGTLMSVEVKNRWGHWIEVYSGPDPQLGKLQEIWVECPEAPLTEAVRVEVEGGHGVEAVAVVKGDELVWSVLNR